MDFHGVQTNEQFTDKNMKTTLSKISTARLLTLAVGAIASVAAVVAQPRLVLQELAIPAGYDETGAAQINDQGYVAGSASRLNGDPVATIWKDGTVKALGKLKDGTYSTATAINSKGVAVGDGDDGDGRPLGWITSGSSLVNFFSNNGGNTRPIAITDSGVVAGYVVKGFTSPWRGAIWKIDAKDPRKSTMTTLPVLPGADPVNAQAISWAFNKSLQGAGWSDGPTGTGQRAVFWNNDVAHTAVNLGVFGNDWTSEASGINDLGQVVGTSHPPFGNRAVLWHNDAAHTIFELPLLPGHNFGSARLINNAGTIIGWSGYDEPGTWNSSDQRMVIWVEGVPYDLVSLVDQATANGWTVVDVSSINNLGQMTATAMRDGMFKAVVLTLVP